MSQGIWIIYQILVKGKQKYNQFPKMIIVTFEPKHIAINLFFVLQSSISPDVLYMIPPLGLY